ncbi:MAG: hypothetical protein WC023_06165 [Rhodocyclaceae bacterium]
MRSTLRVLLLLFLAATARADCGERIELPAHAGTTQRYALAQPAGNEPAISLLLLVGGAGRLALDAQGCPTKLAGNSLVRMRPLFLAHGFVTAYADAPSDHTGDDGLAGFRTDPAHAADLGRIIADLRRRSGAAVWVVGTSRGAISAANAASRLQGAEAPDGIVITSPVTVGNPQGRKAWVSQSVFDLPLESILMPLLLVGHTEDACLRSPASMLQAVAERSPSQRKQVVTVSGGPGASIAPGLEACEARSPHGFLEQEDAVAAGIARFVRGGRY